MLGFWNSKNTIIYKISYIYKMKEKTTKITIKNWHINDRPREKLLNKGKEILSDAELLAILIGSGNKNENAVALAKRILLSVDNDLNALGKLTTRQFMGFNGIGEAKAIGIIASLELGARRKAANIPDRFKVKSSASVFHLLQPVIGTLAHEEFWIVYLNNANKIIESVQLSKGGITGTLVDIRLILKKALELSATALIVAHNHPSGTLIPSHSDKQLTSKLKTACQSLDIMILDHLIITEKTYFSFADEQLL